MLPFGAAVGYLQIAAPFWLRAAGVSLSDIGAISATAFLPHAWKILWVPLLDVGPYRKRWYAGAVVITAALLGGLSLIRDPARHLGLFTLLVAAAQVTASTSSAAVNALTAITTRLADKGRAGGFLMAGNVGGTGVLGALALSLAARASPTTAALVLAGVVLASGSFVLLVEEPRLAEVAADARGLRAALAARFVSVVRDLWATARSREGFTGVLICLTPVGCGALTNLFSGIAADYQAPRHLVEVVNGLGGGVASALGALAGGWLADRMNRRIAYGLTGGLTALTAAAMLAAPMTPTTYAWGTLAYSFANGMAFASWAGMVLELVGHSAGVVTKYALFTATSNQAISYVTWLDGKASEWRGVGARGALGFDVAITFVGLGILLAIVAYTRRRPSQARPASAPRAG
jgi:MFS transporter, PAT family, beta-lactamase induction signal transducer AmpG